MWALERRLSSCGAWASLLRGMWDLPGPGLEPMSPALSGGFLTYGMLFNPHRAMVFSAVQWNYDTQLLGVLGGLNEM